jgi:hypothetical protein
MTCILRSLILLSFLAIAATACSHSDNTLRQPGAVDPSMDLPYYEQ